MERRTGLDGKSRPAHPKPKREPRQFTDKELDDWEREAAEEIAERATEIRKVTPEKVRHDAQQIAIEFGLLARRIEKLLADNRALDRGYRVLDSDSPELARIEEAWERLECAWR